MVEVVFVYLSSHRHRGSVVMRAFQLAEIAQAGLAGRYAASVRAVPPEDRDAQAAALAEVGGGVVILTKAAISHLHPDLREDLRRRSFALVADWIDRPVDPALVGAFDLHLAASRALEAAIRARHPTVPVRHLRHHADLRLRQVVRRYRARAPLYLGHPSNLPDWPVFRARVTVARVAREAQFLRWLPRLGEFDLHAAPRLRHGPDAGLKPLTKLFTAAALGANVVVWRGEGAVADGLGADYPFFAAAATEASFVEALDRAEAARGGPDWHAGLAQMQALAAATAPEAVAAELGAILDELLH